MEKKKQIRDRRMHTVLLPFGGKIIHALTDLHMKCLWKNM